MTTETFGSLLRDRAHWEFEIFLMLLFDGLIVGICWPFLRKHWKHHVARDFAEEHTSNPKNWAGTSVARPTIDPYTDWSGCPPVDVKFDERWPWEIPSQTLGYTADEISAKTAKKP